MQVTKGGKGSSEDLKSDDSYDDDKTPPSSKKIKSGFKSVITLQLVVRKVTMTMRTMIMNDDDFNENENMMQRW
jgi:hypothetical protein